MTSLALGIFKDVEIRGKANTTMSNAVSVTFTASEKPSFLYGPVAATVTVTNRSESDVEVLLPYPNPEHLSFECRVADFARRKQVERRQAGRTVPISIGPGGSYAAVFYLNRYLTFLKPGEAEVFYRLTMLVTSRANTSEVHHEEEMFEGALTVTLVEASESDLRAEMARYSEGLRSSNRQEKTQAAEALAFLETPLSVDYAIPMLSIEGLEIIGIEAVGRHPSRNAFDRLVGMLSHRDSAVVAAALSEIDRHRAVIPRHKVQDLLASDNANTRWIALQWLSARPSKDDLQFVLPLLKDDNTEVRKQAGTYAEVLRRM